MALHDDGCGGHAPALTERELHRYLECGILAHGFARARCADCGHDFIIAFIDEGDAIKKIFSHLGEPADPPLIAPAHGPPLWEAAGQGGDDLLMQPLPEYEFDQRIAW